MGSEVCSSGSMLYVAEYMENNYFNLKVGLRLMAMTAVGVAFYIMHN